MSSLTSPPLPTVSPEPELSESGFLPRLLYELDLARHAIRTHLEASCLAGFSPHQHIMFWSHWRAVGEIYREGWEPHPIHWEVFGELLWIFGLLECAPPDSDYEARCKCDLVVFTNDFLAAIDKIAEWLRDVLHRWNGKAQVAPSTSPHEAPASESEPPSDPNSFSALSIPGKAVAAAYDLKKEGLPVTIKAACERAGVNRSHFSQHHTDAVRLIKALGTPDRQLPRGTKDRHTGTVEAVDDDG